ncbi:hypothetical protein C475_01182 [Halosimplex carlsbadense 2-9-1]|uniref:Uncharacterized protein n=1 Tax=Halosimplex carlsbadense 2-9-1 TaxID=797114 RepID=M0D4C3_9EURY|nr:hypothetical protein [Halosimplex carlsbadense]ELZ30305.1 hypothetical protein C475_01182 [Halosimplex carlsbadense 2-9-1]
MWTTRDQFLVLSMGWVCTALLSLIALDAFSYELFFVCSLIGLLAARELTLTVYVGLTWQRHVYWLTVLGLAGFVFVLVRQFVARVSPWLF